MTIDTLFMDAGIDPCDETETLISRTGLTPFEVTSSATVFDWVNSAEDPVSRGKTTLYITQNQGAVVRECPGTSHYTCCDYTILHTGTFCTMDCSYCILQAYFHPPVLQYFVGRYNLKSSLDALFKQEKIFRIGTGEYTDSLIWERLSDLPSFLVKTFAEQTNSVLELKTKTVNINSLQHIDHNGRTILAWSLNTPGVIASEEKGTASLDARLNAAKKAESWGYRLAFHFDPLVIYEGCEQDYLAVIDRLFETVSEKSIVWISLGTFRFMPALKSIIEQRFPDSTIPYGEFILGLDNKMRYFKPLRTALYQKIVSHIRKLAPDVMLYFCMEDREIWTKTLGFFPGGEGELGHLLDQSAAEHCNLRRL